MYSPDNKKSLLRGIIEKFYPYAIVKIRKRAGLFNGGK
jgi:hypothetical protein